MDSINEILDAIIRGSLLGFLAGFWLMGLAAIWNVVYCCMMCFLLYDMTILS